MPTGDKSGGGEASRPFWETDPPVGPVDSWGDSLVSASTSDLADLVARIENLENLARRDARMRAIGRR